MQLAQNVTAPPFEDDVEFDAFVNELLFALDQPQGWGHPFFESLETLGCGAFSRVVVCPWDEEKAIKITRAARSSDDGWLSWAQFCIRHRELNNPYIPIIFQLRVFKKVTIALLERYDYETDGWEATVTSEWSDNYITLNDDQDTEIACRLAFLNREYGCCCGQAVVGAAWASGELERYEQDWWEFKNLVDDEFCDYLGDVASNNVMVHMKTARVIVTDPLGGYDSYHAKELLKEMGVLVQMGTDTAGDDEYEEEDEYFPSFTYP